MEGAERGFYTGRNCAPLPACCLDGPMLPLSLARRPVLLIVGCGDIGLRVLRLLRGRFRVLALTSSAARIPTLRAAGATPLVGDLDDAPSLGRLAALADA